MAVAVALAYVALSVVQEELRLILTGGFPTLLLGLLLSIVERRSPLVTFSHHCPLITVGCDVDVLLRHMGTPPLLRSSPHDDTAVTTEVKEGTHLRASLRTKLRVMAICLALVTRPGCCGATHLLLVGEVVSTQPSGIEPR